MRFTINVETECDLGRHLSTTTHDGKVANVRISANVRPQDVHFVVAHETAHVVASFMFKGQPDGVTLQGNTSAAMRLPGNVAMDKIVNDMVLNRSK